MTHFNDHNAFRKLLMFGAAAVAFTILPRAILAALPVSHAPHSLALVPQLLRFLPDIGRVGLAITLIGLVPWFLTLGGDSHTENGRSDAAQMRDRAAEARLPQAARTIITHIQEQVDALSAAHAATPVMTEDAFTISEMRRSYLPSTIDAYLAISPLIREHYAEPVISQLRVLDAALSDLMEKAASNPASVLDVNGRFLEERFATTLRSRHPHLWARSARSRSDLND